MRAIWYDRQGPARDVFKLGELPTPEAGPGEVRVRLEASGVNPSDTYRRAGPGGMEYPRVVPNSDGAGVVDQVGPGVDRAWVGKRVWLYNGQRNGRWCGTAAEYIALSVDLVTELPDSVSFAEGATLGIESRLPWCDASLFDALPAHATGSLNPPTDLSAITSYQHPDTETPGRQLPRTP